MNRLRISLSFLLFLLLLQPVNAQKQPRVRSRNLGITTLVLNPLVHQELKLSDEQKAALKKVGSETKKAVTAAQALDDQERNQKTRQATKNLRAAIQKTCSDQQHKRLFQIEIQYTSGSWMLLRQELSGALKLTKDQQRQIREVSRTSQQKVVKLRETRNDDNRQEVQRKINAVLGQARQDAVKLLTEEQQKSWKAAHGEAFEVRPAKKKK
ncbi:MAG: hypothetical protein VB861_08360, partial [Planctomycetaceae bacterium]